MAFLDETFDASGVEPSSPREILPPGKYLAHIIDSEMKTTQAGGKMLSLTLEIQEGEHARRRVWDNLNLVNRNEKAVEIARRTLSAICHAVGRLQVQDSEELHHRPLMITLAVEADNRDEHLSPDDPAKRYKNVTKGYSPVDGAQPAAAAPRPAPAPARAAAPPPPAAKPVSAAPPWRRSA